MLFNYFPNITNEDAERIVADCPVLKDLYFKIDFEISDNDIVSYLYQEEFNDWSRQFNNRIGEIKVTYIFLSYYYEKGIPDNEWYSSPSRKGQSIEFFPNFQEEHYYLKYFFDYFTDVFYYKTFAVWDSIWHLLNIYYHFDLQPGMGFEQKILKLLKDKNPNLYAYLERLNKNDVYKKASNFRNDIAHNFPPNDISSGISREKDAKSRTISMGTGKYISSREFKENIDEIFKLLLSSLKRIKTEMECTKPFT